MSDVPLPKNKKVRSKKNAENLIKKLSELASLTIAILFVSLFAIICGFAGYFAFNLFITRSWCLCH
jgi:ABC-type bacteriocin/lantibiotic exporter with double-glycine peptidase domain